jgi:hypothetical protein
VLPEWWYDAKGCYICSGCYINRYGELLISNNLECPICLENKINIKQTQCIHSICIDCFIRIYYGDDWKFYKSIMFKFGDEVREFRSSETPLREVESGYVLEIVNYFLTTEDVDFLSKVFTFGEPELRINKDSGLYTEMKLSAVELNNLKKVLLAYKYIVNSKIQP